MSVEIRPSAKQAINHADPSRLYFEIVRKNGKRSYQLRSADHFSMPMCIRNFFRALVCMEKHLTWGKFKEELDKGTSKYVLLDDRINELDNDNHVKDFRKALVAKKWQLIAKKAFVVCKGAAEARRNGFHPQLIDPRYYNEVFSPNHFYPAPFAPNKFSVKYLNSQELEKYQAHIEDGKILLPNNQPFEGEGIFVQGPNGHLYIGKQVLGQFHHSSFFSGGAIISAGQFLTNDEGTLISINNISGHYKPKKEHSLTILRTLKNNKIDLSKCSFYETNGFRTKVHKSAQEYLDSQTAQPSLSS